VESKRNSNQIQTYSPIPAIPVGAKVQPLWEGEVKRSYEHDELATKLLQEFGVDAEEGDWKVQGGVIHKKGQNLCGMQESRKRS
jgi:phosphoribosylaminoimidazole-succinocarboxamide synthase